MSRIVLKEKGSLLIEFITAIAFFSLITTTYTYQLIYQSKFFKSALDKKQELSTNYDIINTYKWFCKGLGHQKALLETLLLFDEEFSISCNLPLEKECILERGNKNLTFRI